MKNDEKEQTMKSTINIRVRGYHVDLFRHVNNARYLELLEEGRWAICSLLKQAYRK